jgi:hypothetical protein
LHLFGDWVFIEPLLSNAFLANPLQYKIAKEILISEFLAVVTVQMITM